MTALTAGQRAQLEAALRQHQRQLDDRLAAHHGGLTRAEHAREVLLQDGDDAPARDADREVDLARSDQDMNELRAVKEALLRLQGGKYGLCADCGEEIPFARLQHSPEATRCVACQTAFESSRGPAHRPSI